MLRAFKRTIAVAKKLGKPVMMGLGIGNEEIRPVSRDGRLGMFELDHDIGSCARSGRRRSTSSRACSDLGVMSEPADQPPLFGRRQRCRAHRLRHRGDRDSQRPVRVAIARRAICGCAGLAAGRRQCAGGLLGRPAFFVAHAPSISRYPMPPMRRSCTTSRRSWSSRNDPDFCGHQRAEGCPGPAGERGEASHHGRKFNALFSGSRVAGA